MLFSTPRIVLWLISFQYCSRVTHKICPNSIRQGQVLHPKTFYNTSFHMSVTDFISAYQFSKGILLEHLFIYSTTATLYIRCTRHWSRCSGYSEENNTNDFLTQSVVGVVFRFCREKQYQTVVKGTNFGIGLHGLKPISMIYELYTLEQGTSLCLIFTI